MRLIPNQSPLAAKWVILRSLWSSGEVFGRHISEELTLLGSAEGGSSTERLFTSAGYPAFQKALEKSVGKSKRKKKKCIQTKQVLVNSQTSGNRVGFFCFILYCFSDSSSVFSFYYKSVFSFLEGLHPFRTANAEHCIIYKSSVTPWFYKIIQRGYIWTR